MRFVTKFDTDDEVYIINCENKLIKCIVKDIIIEFLYKQKCVVSYNLEYGNNQAEAREENEIYTMQEEDNESTKNKYRQ